MLRGNASHAGTQLPTLFMIIFLISLLCATATSYDPNGVHILFLTDCTEYSNWQTLGMAFSYKNSGQKGRITRVMCCTAKEKANYPQEMLEIMETHVAPSFAFNNKTNDFYAAFNKPGAVLDFMQHGKPDADWMLVIDSDMQLRHPFDPEHHKMTKGHALSADYRYMVGCTNDLASRHIPEIGKQNNTLAGPDGRWCDQVGGWVFMHKDDLARVAPLWLSMTVDVREDPESWRLTGDSYVKKGERAWISEMYGYAFSCARSNVWHEWDLSIMHYPTYAPKPFAIPKLIHYGLLFEIGNYSFDKHWQYVFNVRECPPWDLSEIKSRKGGVFQHPPRPSELRHLKNYEEGDNVMYGHLLAIETVATVNAGFCHYHLHHCPPSLQMLKECEIAWDIYQEVKTAIEVYETKLKKATDPPLSKPLLGVASIELKEGLAALRSKLAATASPISEAGGGRPATDTPAGRLGGGVTAAVQAAGGGQSISTKRSKDASAGQLGSGVTGAIQAVGGGRSTGDEGIELRAACLKHSLGADEVLKCVEAAGRGEHYAFPSKVAQPPIIKGLSQDLEDLSLRPSVKAVSPVDTDEKLQIVRRSLTPSRSIPWDKVAVVVLFILLILAVLPAAMRGGRRTRSGLRSE